MSNVPLNQAPRQFEYNSSNESKNRYNRDNAIELDGTGTPNINDNFKRFNDMPTLTQVKQVAWTAGIEVANVVAEDVGYSALSMAVAASANAVGFDVDYVDVGEVMTVGALATAGLQRVYNAVESHIPPVPYVSAFLDRYSTMVPSYVKEGAKQFIAGAVKGGLAAEIGYEALSHLGSQTVGVDIDTGRKALVATCMLAGVVYQLGKGPAIQGASWLMNSVGSYWTANQATLRQSSTVSHTGNPILDGNTLTQPLNDGQGGTVDGQGLRRKLTGQSQDLNAV